MNVNVFLKPGIIGGGLSGTSSAHFLRNLFGEKVSIDLFESGRVGGRTSLIKINGVNYEAGGSIIHKKNRYMDQFAKEFGKSMYCIYIVCIFFLIKYSTFSVKNFKTLSEK